MVLAGLAKFHGRFLLLFSATAHAFFWEYTDGVRAEPTAPGCLACEQRLLACLYGKDALEVGEVLEALYCHDHEQDQDALRSVVRRLNPKLHKQSFPGK